MSTDPALDIAKWLVEQRPGLTHLKVQKLCFYAYGYLTALADTEAAQFEAWQHGPVSRAVWDELKLFGSEPVRLGPSARSWSDSQRAVLEDVLTVYGALSAWQLREQSHEEAPWRDSFSRRLIIPDRDIREHFLRKVTPGSVELPDSLSNAWSLRLDGLPTPRFTSFHDAAEAIRTSTSVS